MPANVKMKGREISTLKTQEHEVVGGSGTQDCCHRLRLPARICTVAPRMKNGS